jgi:hypothetical protein
LLAPVLGASLFAGGVWVYFNQDEEVYEYWRQVEQGNVPVEDDDDEDWDEDDEEDEWADDEDVKPDSSSPS